jgi:hypothetical protein
LLGILRRRQYAEHNKDLEAALRDVLGSLLAAMFGATRTLP